MYCHNCGKEVTDGSTFCSYCGTKLQPAEEGGARPSPEEIAVQPGTRQLISLPNVLYVLLLIFTPLSLHFGITGSKGVRLAVETVGLTAPALITVIIYNYLRGENDRVKWISSGISLLLLIVVMISIVGSIAKSRKAETPAPVMNYQQQQQLPQPLQSENPSPSPAVINVNVAVAQSALIDVPETMERVHLADPKVAEIKLITPTKMEITGKTKGVTPLTVLDKSGQTMLFSINVN